ncbi:MAG: hypothetical protein QUS35_09320 [bacterium]|nr:hypothetical protein [bacterium]
MTRQIMVALALAGLCLSAAPETSGQESAWTRARMSAFLTAADTATSSASAPVAVGAGSRPLRSARLAGFLSAAVPGAGQAYAGSWIKAAAFLAIETAAWIGYSHYTDKGDVLRREFRAYADEHWSRERWHAAYVEGQDPSTHALPEYNTQQYYEMIGKYDQFMKGWDDWVPGGPNLTENRYYYESRRREHNEQLINASQCAMAALGNHLISALDAAWTVRRGNRSLSLRVAPGFRTAFASAEAVPAMNLRAAW